MAARMYRLPASKVYQTGRCSFVQDNGVMVSAPPGRKGLHLFSEVGAGIKPLCLIGMWNEVIGWFEQHRTGGIDNRIKSLPEIYMRAMFYRPSNRYKGLFPAHDAMKALAEGFAGVGSAGLGNAFSVEGSASNIVASVGGVLKDSVDIKRRFLRKNKKTVSHVATNPLAITFSYLPTTKGHALTQIGSKRIKYGDILAEVQGQILELVGQR